ncbi:MULTISPECIES: 3-(cis-5,6-dihydroxycyclohexa-1,3-dien-1-yl)propanoate dehydrogenase [Mycolicibacterium]|uniref:2,3-dihydroxy-2,3-dihydrophenylpropionate dehydrogenase n=1 Tax=Mycolicibacterium vanbaalenii (strain DSM 7251 / JCM 13017 / BCRC 16820 / KCTC 9966 / NRRL B-24157 / PYR-1) TaxID=350058 RepID=A1TDD8_MYCVP|nr:MULTISPECIES: 3-(cis-5,6-dihydroxycyclohexa-1,3-dien-1-yl)propanoate dehydrogenase [Mycolicibacterium]ABM15188.1 2,3-dihydroxy-2,3-dihydrophenylpropionate dehydrogenase [Mycolicibacterium vanbaalenii PYR-1]MCV7127068.1 3-(cis-5,6-dihydroxycyclohexa-1,3-dien-1-yl)propanoate dehydrogenase [Mycolicibacterium vanbaalenii PYR-1]QZT55554.1 3-(cis-5,6-dihydroxycyclohexa-1,3-dien-1-yl)propanoate dehydrogenase [Mycolicibacterium austroafricanum]QZT61505.1 3-(cis-5,6-dihydroxycyclohexa-1,3-dien-1-yl)p
MDWLDNQVVLVTGGGSGLGRSLVERFIDEGAQVGVLELNEEKAAAIAARWGDRVCSVVGDATSYADNERAVQATVAAFGKLDTLVGNAGLWDFGTPLEQLKPEQISPAFDEIFGLNVKGYLLGARAALAELRETRGSIIFTVSNAGFWPGGGGPLYTASKHAVVGLVKQLAYELCPEVRVNGVAPGGMPSDLRGPRALDLQETAFDSLPVDELVQRLSPLEAPIHAEDYTGHYVLLASRANGSTATGSVHNCDGGVGVAGRKLTEKVRAELFGRGA